jgi:hypothetical protein
MVISPSQERIGLEVMRATDEHDQRTLTRSEKEFRRRGLQAEASGQEPEPVITQMYAPGSPVPGWGGNQPEARLCALFKTAVERKLKKFTDFRPVSRYDWLIFDDTLVTADRQKVLSAIHPYVKQLQERNLKLGRISFIVSLDVLYDLGGEARLFRYIEPPNLEDSESLKIFSERSEYAAQLSAERAVRKQIQQGIPIYSGGGTGRVVKQMPDGRRFEVTFLQNGEEVIVRELTHK